MIDPKLTEVDNVYAHINMLSFILEHVVVDGMLSLPSGEAEQWRRELARQMRSTSAPPGADSDQALRICKRSADLADAFFAKVAEREAGRRTRMQE